MRKIFFTLIFAASQIFIFAQKSYFQQTVNYKIDVTLDDEKHRIKGNIDIEYVNNSPDALDKIYMHLWGNAYKNQTTAFAKQQLNQRKLRFFRAKEENLGFYENVAFMVDGASTAWEWDKKNPDIAVITLKKPLLAGEKIHITTPLELKIPSSFSRLGHVNQSYQMTQWFPKPAVYDHKGWHPMPYLDQGEFFSEFGNFDVTITLPENYVVGATGTCQQSTEYEFLQQRVNATEAQMKKGFEKTLDFPPSATKTKTLRYLADNVHDFAWFADKRFWVLKNEAILATGKKVDCWVMFTNHDAQYWKKASDYVSRSVKFYSEKVGEYSYPHATAVQSALSAGGGMEYPMITVIGDVGGDKSLDVVITHEVGHNWFYGILASNEREHGWMDEGMNTYYEYLYTQTFYPKKNKRARFMNIGDDELMSVGLSWFAAQNEDQAPATHSKDFLPINYGTCMYGKTGKSLEALAAAIDTATYDAMMKAYFEKWKFKHPYPEDFRQHCETFTKRNLSWFFDGTINSNEQVKMTFLPNKVKNNLNSDLLLKVRSTGLNVPIVIDAYKNRRIVASKVYEKPATEKEIEVTFPKGDYDKLVLDGDYRYTQTNRFGTTIRPNGSFPKQYFLPQLKVLNGIERTDRRFNVGVLPVFATNKYDKLQLGLAFHSAMLPTSADRVFYAVPLYSFSQKQLNGIAAAKKSWYPKKGKIASFDLEGNLRGFSSNYDDGYDFTDRYRRVQLGTTINLRKSKLTSPKSASISARVVNITNFYGQGVDFLAKKWKDTTSSYNIGEVKLTLKNDFILSPRTFSVTLQAGKGFSKIFAQFNNKVQFERKREALYIHAFAGSFLQYKNPNAYVSFQSNGITTSSPSQRDYMYDNLMLARSQRTPRYYFTPIGTKDTLIGGGWQSQQIFMQDASMRTLGIALQSESWLMGAGAAYNLPLPLPVGLRPYFDFSLVPEKDIIGKNKITAAYTAGVGVIVVPDIFEIYLPIPVRKEDGWQTLDKNLYFDKREKYYQRIAFMLNLNKLNPYKLTKDNRFKLF
jgi:Peptidase family M1 domain